MATIGQRIRMRRLALGLSIDDLVERLGKDRATIYRYESDDIVNFPTSILPKLCAVLETTPSYIIGMSEEQDEFSAAFRKSLGEELDALDDDSKVEPSAKADYWFLREVADSSQPLMLAEACRAADALGASVDGLVSKGKPALEAEDGPDAEILKILISLSDNRKQEALNYLRYLVASEDK